MITVNALGEACPMPVVPRQRKRSTRSLRRRPCRYSSITTPPCRISSVSPDSTASPSAPKSRAKRSFQSRSTPPAPKDVADEAVVCAPLKQGEKTS